MNFVQVGTEGLNFEKLFPYEGLPKPVFLIPYGNKPSCWSCVGFNILDEEGFPVNFQASFHTCEIFIRPGPEIYGWDTLGKNEIFYKEVFSSVYKK